MIGVVSGGYDGAEMAYLELWPRVLRLTPPIETSETEESQCIPSIRPAQESRETREREVEYLCGKDEVLGIMRSASGRQVRGC